METINLIKLGVLRCEEIYPQQLPRQASLNRQNKGVIHIDSQGPYREALEGLDGFSHIWLIYQFHKNSHWKPKVLPPGVDSKKVGVFATRAPYRPNPLGLSCVRLDKVDGRRIYISQFDLLDETPILDIKPYVVYADSFPQARQGWLPQTSPYSIEISDQVQEQLLWIEHHGALSLQSFLYSQLSYDPTDQRRKRIEPISLIEPTEVIESTEPIKPIQPIESNELSESREAMAGENSVSRKNQMWGIAFRTWRIHYQVDATNQKLKVIQINSGYNNRELSEALDPYKDKKVHRDFLKSFRKK